MLAKIRLQYPQYDFIWHSKGQDPFSYEISGHSAFLLSRLALLVHCSAVCHHAQISYCGIEKEL